MADVYNEMRQAYYTNDDFRWYVVRVSEAYQKSPTEVLYSPITKEYYLSLKKGGCNERREYADAQQ